MRPKLPVHTEQSIDRDRVNREIDRKRAESVFDGLGLSILKSLAFCGVVVVLLLGLNQVLGAFR